MADLRGIRGNVLRHRAVPSCGRQSNREARKSDGNTVRQLCKLTDNPNVELKRIQTRPGIKKLLVHERQSEMKRLAGRTERLSRFAETGSSRHNQKTLRRITKLRFN